MERRLELRLEELLADAVLDPRVPEGMPHRLEQSVEPFAARLTSSEQRQHAREYVAGRLSEVKRKNSEMIACLHDQDRQAMQKSTGQSPRHHRPLIAELAQQVGGEQGQPDGVLVFDPSAFRKQGKHSVGVARQWCGRMGKIDNCQVRVYLGYVSRIEHALLDVRLYLNMDWAKDKKRAHCQAADLPSDDEAPGDPHFIGTSTSEPSNVAPTEARSLPASASRHNCTSA